MTTDVPGGRVGLGPYVLDRDQLLLLHGAAAEGACKLTPKAAAVLELLLVVPGRTVTRQQLFDAVWPGSCSSDEVLTTVINELRRAFSDQARQPSYIATVPKLGYRWCGPHPQPVLDAGASVAAVEAAPQAEAREAGEAGGDPENLAAWSARWRRSRRGGRAGWEPYALALATVVSGSLLLTWLRGGRLPALADRPPTVQVTATPLALPAVTTVVAEPGLDVDPDISRDGRQYAYIHRDPVQGAQLWYGSTGSGAVAQRVDLPADGHPAGPAWSPVGGAIAFLWLSGSDCELRVLTLASAQVTTLAEGCPYSVETSVDWSPDGRTLVFTRADGRHPVLANRHPALFTIGADGRNLRRLSLAGRWLNVDLHPRFSPDGQRIAFIRDGDGRREVVHLRARDGGDERVLPLALWAYRLDWLDGAQLLVSGHGQSPFEIWQVALDGSRVARLASTSLGPGLSVRAGSRSVLTEQRRQDDNLWRLSLADPLATPERWSSSTRNERDPRLSPDGRQLAFLVDRGGNFEVDVLQLSSGQRTRWSDVAPYTVLDVRWSPDGRGLVLLVGTEQGKRLALVDGPGARRNVPESLSDLPIAQVEFDPGASRLLLIAARNGRRELLAVDWPGLRTAPELVVDFSVASMARDATAGELWLTRAEDGASFAIDRAGRRRPLAQTIGPVAPDDHWAVDGGRLLLARRTGEGEPMRMRWLDGDRSERRQLLLRPPEPPLGRPFDLRDGWLWYGQRDLDESDLVELAWPRDRP